MLRTFVIVCIGYVFDIAPSFRQAMWTLRLPFQQRFNISQLSVLGLQKIDFIIILFGMLTIFATSLLQEWKQQSVRCLIDKHHPVFEWIIVVIALLFIAVFGVYGSGYNATDFVYMQF